MSLTVNDKYETFAIFVQEIDVYLGHCFIQYTNSDILYLEIKEHKLKGRLLSFESNNLLILTPVFA
jgi:hypothetical protein